MRRMNSSNPVFRNIEKNHTYETERTASYAGIGLKTGLMLLLAVVGGVYSFYLLNKNPQALGIILPIAGLTAFISVIVASFSVRLSGPFSLLYAAAEGVTIGTITVLLESVFPGIASIAVIGTFVIFGVMLLLYTSRTIRVTHRFRKTMYGILLSMLVFSIISIFIPSINVLFVQNPVVAILTSAFFLIYGAFMLTMDFDRAETIVRMGADKRYEWNIALGLMVTIIWIYIEILRILVIIFSSNRE